MPNKTHHIVHDSEGGWNVQKGGASKPSGHFDTKKEAELAGRIISQNQGSELYIHGMDGKIQRKDSHGNDLFPPKG
jgi:hypothetical protein